MGKVANTNLQVSAVLPKEAVVVIDTRRAGQSMTRSKCVSLIVARWYADGCPPVNDADNAIRTLHGIKGVPDKKG